MLSRHAEDLFWFGRYIERAEVTARMLDVTYHHMLESPPGDADVAWQELLKVLYLDATYEGPLDSRSVSQFLVTDVSNPGSIISGVRRARDNARGLRDRISTELWEAMNVFYLDIQNADLESGVDRRAYEILDTVKSRCQLIAGVASQTMPRDEGYRFMILGLMLERAEMTCRLLTVRYTKAVSAGDLMRFHGWVSVLKSVSAYEAYLKAHDAALDPTRVLEFLLLDPQFPRSVLYSLETAERQLALISSGLGHMDAQRAIGRARARVEFSDVESIANDGLDVFLEDLQGEVYEVATAVDKQFFRVGTDLELQTIQST